MKIKSFFAVVALVSAFLFTSCNCSPEMETTSTDTTEVVMDSLELDSFGFEASQMMDSVSVVDSL